MVSTKRRALLAILALCVAAVVLVAGMVTGAYAYREMAGRGDEVTSRAAAGASASAMQAQEEAPLSEQGVLVMHVAADSPAAAAGLRRGSIILAVDGAAVATPAELQQAIRSQAAGDTIIITALVCEAPQDIEVTLESAGPYLGIEVGRGELGVFPGPAEGFFSPGLPGEPGPNAHLLGSAVIIAGVVPNSPAAEAGLEVGDQVTALDGERIESREELIALLSGKAAGNTIELTIERGGESQTMTITLAGHPSNAERAFLGVNLIPQPPFIQEFRWEAPDLEPEPQGSA
jgi:S1-C subfamily serine protease